ncbi:YaaW family protein [Leptolyngbya sp. AN02str]|uniref:YaaW family protein n=1 Tax=Leptolyngbya sp. AN02str TaxID=3423363 RepID=UPI003D313851
MDELRAALELATYDELELLTEILFRRKLNPLDYVCTPDPLDVQSQDRDDWIDALEDRFRFLAADGMTVLRGKSAEISYRHVLIQVCRYLKIPYSQSLSTPDIEAEIFLHMLHRAWCKLSPREQQTFSGELQRAVSQSELAKQLPPSFQTDPAALLLKGGSVVAINSLVRPWLLQQMARQFMLHAAKYQVARQAVQTGAIASQVALQTAQRSMAVSAARYGAVRSVFAVVGPALWMWLFVDLGWRAIATNYARVIPVVFTLAQIRLTRAGMYQLA